MRLFFPNSSRPKRAAKHLAAQLHVSLSSAQRAVARACGYCDWHELEGQVSSGPACVLDQRLASDKYTARQCGLIITIARDLSVADGDVQHALADARLTGDRPPRLDEQITIRLNCWRSTDLPLVSNRQPGAVGKLKTAGRSGEEVILRAFGRPTDVVSAGNMTMVGDFEYISPRVAPSLFLPMRLYLPYGYWTESDGARVLFSRDYAPLWRLKIGRSPERVAPWLRFNFAEPIILWRGNKTPWASTELKSHLEEFLMENGIFTLPMLADALPLLVHDRPIDRPKMADAAELLRAQRSAPKWAA